MLQCEWKSHPGKPTLLTGLRNNVSSDYLWYVPKYICNQNYSTPMQIRCTGKIKNFQLFAIEEIKQEQFK